MRRYDYSFIKDLRIRTDTVSLMNMIGSFRMSEKEKKRGDRGAFTALESLAKIESVKRSNEIEGIVTTDKRIEDIMNRNSAPLNHNEMEIAGYRDALNLIHNDHGSIGMTADTVLNLHRIMMSYTPRKGGKYKESDNVIIDVDREGRKSVRFRPVLSDDTVASMEQLILAYMDAKDDSGIDPVILIPCFILDFLCIHPFSDGNGRISRLLSLLLMYRNGIDVGKYISFEGQINASKRDYYESLRRSSEGWHTNSNDYLPFIEYFIFVLFTCYKELDRRFEVVEGKNVNKGNRVEAAVINSVGSISKKEIKELLPDVSSRTIEVKLSELLKDGKIKKIGGYKDARYTR